MISSWKLSRSERIWLVVGAFGLVLFGANLEKRTALRREPMTDLGVFSCASWAAWHGGDIYQVTDWHGWHYQYPPALAILFGPLSHPVPTPLPKLEAGAERTAANTPWGYKINGPNFFGLHQENLRFFFIAGIWYLLSVGLVLLAAHAIGCILEQTKVSSGPTVAGFPRRRWWALRWLPLAACAGSIGTDWSRGQVDVLMLAAIALGLYFAVSRFEVTSGVLLAFPATVKLFPPLLLLYPLWRGRWRMAIGILAGLLFFLAVLPAVTLGPARTRELYGAWSQVLAKPALGVGTDTSRAKELTGMNSTDNQSLLAGIHNWRYREMPRRERPAAAGQGERYAVYAAGILLLIGVAMAGGFRRSDSPRELLLVSGLLIGVALVVSPIVHNYYYLLMLPLIAGLLDFALPREDGARPKWKIIGVIVFFTATDLLARLPGVGPRLRDWGVPLVSLLCLLFTAALVLYRYRNSAAGMVEQGRRVSASI